MKNVLALIGAVTVAVGVVAAAALVVKKYLDKVEEKKRIEEEGKRKGFAKILFCFCFKSCTKLRRIIHLFFCCRSG